MAMTLLEAKKLSTNATQLFVINEFIRSRLLQVLPFRNVLGGALNYNTVGELPGVGFRGINQSFDESTGVLVPQSESLKLFGGDMKVDTAIVDREGTEGRTAHLQLKLEAARLRFEKAFFKGDAALEPREFDGLQKRITGNQLIVNGADGTGNALSIDSLKKAIDAVKAGTGRKYLFMNETVKRRIEGYYEGTANGMLRYSVNEQGEEIMNYRGCEIVVIEDDEAGNAILPFTETSPDGSTTTDNTSIYCVRFGDLLTTGIQGPSSGVNGIYAEDFGRIQASPHYLTRVNWDCGLATLNGRSVSRLHGIQDAVAVA
ncbi:MAG: major capsid protein [Cyanobacteria bacterium J06554_11]